MPKPGPAKFLLTVDLRPVNRFTVKHQLLMLNIEQELTKRARANYFAKFDLSHGYWQLPLGEASQSSQAFITSDGIYSPIRVLHSTTNAVTRLQSGNLRFHIISHCHIEPEATRPSKDSAKTWSGSLRPFSRSLRQNMTNGRIGSKLFKAFSAMHLLLNVEVLHQSRPF